MKEYKLNKQQTVMERSINLRNSHSLQGGTLSANKSTLKNAGRAQFHSMSGASTSSPKTMQGDKTNLLLTPKVEYYKNLVDYYKRTLDTLNGQSAQQSGPVKQTLDFLNKQHTTTTQYTTMGSNDDTRSKSNYQPDGGSNPLLRNLPYLDKDGNVVGKQQKQPASDKEFTNASSIIMNAKSEKYMLDFEKYKYRPKKESFTHEALGKNAINRYFSQINDSIEQIASQVVNNQVTAHKKEFISKYNGEINSLQQNYRDLQQQADMTQAQQQLRDEIVEKTQHRDQMRVECQKIDQECKDKMDELQGLRDKHNQQAEQRKFLEEQIASALDGRARLSKKKDELTEELRKLEEDEENAEPLRMSPERKQTQQTIDESNEQYYQDVRKKLKDFIGHLQKRNDTQRDAILIIQDSEYPFEAIFQDKLRQVKEEIAERRNRAALVMSLGVGTSKSIPAIKPPSHHMGINQRSSETLMVAEPRHGLSEPLTPDTVKLAHITEPDKRRLMSLFLSSEDILYFTYGLLYPQAVIQMQAQMAQAMGGAMSAGQTSPQMKGSGMGPSSGQSRMPHNYYSGSTRTLNPTLKIFLYYNTSLVWWNEVIREEDDN